MKAPYQLHPFDHYYGLFAAIFLVFHSLPTAVLVLGDWGQALSRSPHLERLLLLLH